MANCDREFWEEFFNLYRLHPCLWDSKSSDYLNRHKRNDAYNELVLKCKEKFPQANKDFVTKKIHGFRCCFRRELKKVRGNKSGDGADDVYVPNLWYYDILSFIADSETPRVGKTNIPDCDNDLDEELDDQEPTEYFFKDISSECDDITQDTVESTQSLSKTSMCSTSETESSSSIMKKPPIKSKGKRTLSKSDELIDMANKTLKQFCSSPQVEKTDDAFDISGKKYANDLRNIGCPQQRTIVEKLVSDVIYYEKLNKLNENSLFLLSGSNTTFPNSASRSNERVYHPSYMTNASYEFPPTIVQPSTQTSTTKEELYGQLTNYVCFNNNQ